MLYSAQIRAARALLGWSQGDLARKAGVGAATVQRLESGQGIVSGQVSTVVRVQEALEAAGARFLAADDTGGVGVRLRKLAP